MNECLILNLFVNQGTQTQRFNKFKNSVLAPFPYKLSTEIIKIDCTRDKHYLINTLTFPALIKIIYMLSYGTKLNSDAVHELGPPRNFKFS
jgi:hypothetical protein